MPRGGYQKPSSPAPVSGPGKFSKRTDSGPKGAPDLDTPGQQYGDRQMLEAAQKAAPPKGASGASVPRHMQGSAPVRAGGSLPPWFFQQDSSAPDEPATAGLDMGAGPGSEVLDAAQPPEDEREVVLEYLATTFQNATAAKHLADYRNERAGSQPVAPSAIPSAPTLESTPEAQPAEPTLA